MRLGSGEITYWMLRFLIHAHRFVSLEPLVLWSDLPGAVGESPRWVDQNCAIVARKPSEKVSLTIERLVRSLLFLLVFPSIKCTVLALVLQLTLRVNR